MVGRPSARHDQGIIEGWIGVAPRHAVAQGLVLQAQGLCKDRLVRAHVQQSSGGDGGHPVAALPGHPGAVLPETAHRELCTGSGQRLFKHFEKPSLLKPSLFV